MSLPSFISLQWPPYVLRQTLDMLSIHSLSFCKSSVKARFVDHASDSCPVIRFLPSEALILLQLLKVVCWDEFYVRISYTISDVHGFLSFKLLQSQIGDKIKMNYILLYLFFFTYSTWPVPFIRLTSDRGNLMLTSNISKIKSASTLPVKVMWLRSVRMCSVHCGGIS